MSVGYADIGACNLLPWPTLCDARPPKRHLQVLRADVCAIGDMLVRSKILVPVDKGVDRYVCARVRTVGDGVGSGRGRAWGWASVSGSGDPMLLSCDVSANRIRALF